MASRQSPTRGLPAIRHRSTSTSEVGTRLISGHTLNLDDPLTQRRIATRELDYWRDFGVHYFVPCVSKEGTIAVMALGRKASSEPLSSEDMALLAAVAAQAATALENGRLYRQLHVKADELDRLREFSDNILESLNDGLAVVNRDDRVAALEPAARRAVRPAARRVLSNGVSTTSSTAGSSKRSGARVVNRRKARPSIAWR